MLFMYCRTGLMQGDLLNHYVLMMFMNVTGYCTQSWYMFQYNATIICPSKDT